MADMTAGPSTQGWKRRREETSESFEKAALALFAERGYHNVTVADVADAAGVTARTLFRYFPTKEDLLLALPRRSVARLELALSELEPSDEPVQTVWQLLVDLSSYHRPAADTIQLWSRAIADAPEVLARMRGERVTVIEGALTAYFATSLGVDTSTDVRPSVLAASLHAAERAVMNHWAAHQSRPDLATLFEEAFSSLFQLHGSVDGSRHS